MIKVIEIGLDEFSTEELMKELKERGTMPSVNELLKILEDTKCPENLIYQLREWENQPTITPLKLQQWKEFAAR